ncbi:MAG: ribbon-helix-helix domain-containing protein [Alphaproteobacteria bacterium]
MTTANRQLATAEAMPMNTPSNGIAAAKAPSQDPILISGGPKKTRPLSTLVSRNIIVSGHRTSVRLEPEMWEGLREIALRERSTLHQICTSVSLQKADESSLTASIRVFIMRYFRNAATEDGHKKAAHGFGLTLGMGSPGSMMNPPAYGNRSAAVLTKTSFA